MTNTDDYEARYAEIMRRIEGRRGQAGNPARQADLSLILDGLNALGFLDDVRKKRPRAYSLYGPKAVRGQITGEAGACGWVGAVAWYKPRGYYHYQRLNLVGIWAIDLPDSPQILIGSKTLEFDAPVFNPESYHRHIKRGFDLYYRGDASPQVEREYYRARYDASQRLAQRDAIQAALADWADSLRERE